jgi:hypothetical protein
MVPGHVQGLSRVPPDRPEGGAGGELDSDGLWWTPGSEGRRQNEECRMQNRRAKPPEATAVRRQNAECGITGQSQLKPHQCDIQATLKRVDSQGIATLKPP